MRCAACGVRGGVAVKYRYRLQCVLSGEVSSIISIVIRLYYCAHVIRFSPVRHDLAAGDAGGAQKKWVDVAIDRFDRGETVQ